MFVTRDHAILRTVAFGPGPDTLLALNGWSAAWEAWQPTFEQLSRTTRCISYDTRGCGASDGDPAHITLDALVDDVFAVLDAHGADRCVLAGESLGGFVALHAALRDPRRFSGLVLIAAPPSIDEATASARATAARADYAGTVRAFTRACFAPEVDDDHLLAWGEALFLGAGGEVAARLFEACVGAHPDLAAVDVPTLVVHGDQDQVVPVAAGRFLAATIPGARLVELAGASHAPTVTRAAELTELVRSMFG
jgi:pimeloyl-ACP methyl ester carboxylesterase